MDLSTLPWRELERKVFALNPRPPCRSRSRFELAPILHIHICTFERCYIDTYKSIYTFSIGVSAPKPIPFIRKWRLNKI